MLIWYTSWLKKLTKDNLCGQPYTIVIHCKNLEQNQGSMIYAYCVSSTLLNAKGCIIHVKHHIFYKTCYARNVSTALKDTTQVSCYVWKELSSMVKNLGNSNIDFDYRLKCIITIIFLTFPWLSIFTFYAVLCIHLISILLFQTQFTDD